MGEYPETGKIGDTSLLKKRATVIDLLNSWGTALNKIAMAYDESRGGSIGPDDMQDIAKRALLDAGITISIVPENNKKEK